MSERKKDIDYFVEKLEKLIKSDDDDQMSIKRKELKEINDDLEEKSKDPTRFLTILLTLNGAVIGLSFNYIKDYILAVTFVMTLGIFVSYTIFTRVINIQSYTNWLIHRRTYVEWEINTLEDKEKKVNKETKTETTKPTKNEKQIEDFGYDKPLWKYSYRAFVEDPLNWVCMCIAVMIYGLLGALFLAIYYYFKKWNESGLTIDQKTEKAVIILGVFIILFVVFITYRFISWYIKLLKVYKDEYYYYPPPEEEKSKKKLKKNSI